MTLLEERNIRAYDLWRLALQQKNIDDRIELLEKSSALDAYRPNVWHALAKCYYNVNRYNDCERAINLGLLIDEHDEFLLKDKMWFELDRGNTPAAIEAIDKMPVPAKTRERNERARLRISILITANRFEEALEDLTKLTNRPHPAMEDLADLGRLAEQMDRQETALDAFTRLRKMNPKDKSLARVVEDFFLRHP
jgi:tetratricopeptide (TPR) repeat protein